MRRMALYYHAGLGVLLQGIALAPLVDRRLLTLTAVLERLLASEPGDVSDVVRREVAGLDELLTRLDGFAGWDADAQEAALVALDRSGDRTFAALVIAAHTAYYADPRSWSQLGYTTNVPGRP